LSSRGKKTRAQLNFDVERAHRVEDVHFDYAEMGGSKRKQVGRSTGTKSNTALDASNCKFVWMKPGIKGEDSFLLSKLPWLTQLADSVAGRERTCTKALKSQHTFF